jgi:Amt family ammonium transporter
MRPSAFSPLLTVLSKLPPLFLLRWLVSLSLFLSVGTPALAQYSDTVGLAPGAMIAQASEVPPTEPAPRPWPRWRRRCPCRPMPTGPIRPGC